MNAVEIEEALSALSIEPFDVEEFPFAFLAAFGNKEATIKRLRKGDSNASDVAGGVLQRNNIHIATCAAGEVLATLQTLRESPKSQTAKPKFLLATDGQTLEAEDLASGEVLACEFEQFADHFGFFLPLAGISTVKEIKENPIDVRATGRLNKLYIELLQNNQSWASEERRTDMNHFMARLVFCFFAEDTDIFQGTSLFTHTLEQMTERDGSNAHEVLQLIFKAMDTATSDRPMAKLPRWAEKFPYVNGGLFSGRTEVPQFTRTARSYLLRTGELNWKKINPDIFGSMIQAVADDEERGALGMHYTSVPNILKVLNPLFLDDLRGQLEAAGGNKVKLLNLRKRMARIRVFDPACGSGNFLVIAYKQMREIEYEINRLRGEEQVRTEIPLTNFRGIELRSFPAEIARLALVIAEFQCDVLYRGQKEALADVLPLDSSNWIVCDNALKVDWSSVCPAVGTSVKVVSLDLLPESLPHSEVDFDNVGGETFVCGNPPYLGSRTQDEQQKQDLGRVLSGHSSSWRSLDYVAAWFVLAAEYIRGANARAAFVATNSICQGIQAPILWPLISSMGSRISFAHTSFKWQNLASRNAGVTVVIVGISHEPSGTRRIYSQSEDGIVSVRLASTINSYLVAADDVVVEKKSSPQSQLSEMTFGNTPIDGGNLLLSSQDVAELGLTDDQCNRFVRTVYGSAEFIRGTRRYCLWIEDQYLAEALAIDSIRGRVSRVKELRLKGGTTAREIADRPHQFQRMITGHSHTIVVPIHTSETREFLPVGVLPSRAVVTNAVCAMYDAPLWNLALIASRLHLVWVAAVCGKLETRYRYSNTLGWNTFPVPPLTERNELDLIRCAEDILIAREACFPASLSDLYDPEEMPEDLRRAHERNDEVLERIYIGRRFKNDTERLEKLFDLYTKMTANHGKNKRRAAGK